MSTLTNLQKQTKINSTDVNWQENGIGENYTGKI